MSNIKYDYTNLFREMIDGQHEVKIYKETSFTLVIFDIAPKYKTHLLVLPKGSYINFHDMMNNATDEEILDFYKTINYIISNTNLHKGYQLFANSGKAHGQEIMHYHMHLVSHFGL